MGAFSSKRRRAELTELETCRAVHSPYVDIAAQIKQQVDEVVAQQTESLEAAAGGTTPLPDIDATLRAVIDGITQEETTSRLRELFRQLPLALQWELLVGRLDDALVTQALQSEQDRLRREADPDAAIEAVITAAKQSGYISVNRLPRDVRVEIDLYRNGATVEWPVKAKHIRRRLVLQTVGNDADLVVLADKLGEVIYDVNDLLKRGSTVQLGSTVTEADGSTGRRIYRDVPLDSSNRKGALRYRSKTDYEWYQLCVCAVRLNTQEVFAV